MCDFDAREDTKSPSPITHRRGPTSPLLRTNPPASTIAAAATTTNAHSHSCFLVLVILDPGKSFHRGTILVTETPSTLSCCHRYSTTMTCWSRQDVQPPPGSRCFLTSVFVQLIHQNLRQPNAPFGAGHIRRWWGFVSPKLINRFSWTHEGGWTVGDWVDTTRRNHPNFEPFGWRQGVALEQNVDDPDTEAD